MKFGYLKFGQRIGVAIGVAAVFIVTAGVAPARAAAVRTETVKFANGKDMTSGFLATPEKTGRYGAIIVASEWWGLTDWVKDQTSKLAGEGYVVLAVDFYDGKVATDATQASEWSGALKRDAVETVLENGLRFLSTRQDVDRSHAAALGWGMGAGYVLNLAVHVPALGACVVNYGLLPTDPNDLQLIFAPVLGNFGAEDHGVTSADARAFEKTLKGLQRRVDIKIYDGAGHAFENPANSAAYRPEAAEDAWSRTIAFLSKTMK